MMRATASFALSVPALLVAAAASCGGHAAPMASAPGRASSSAGPTDTGATSRPDAGTECHDDATVSVTPGLDGVPVVCAAPQVSWTLVIEALDRLKQARHILRFVLATGGTAPRRTQPIQVPSAAQLLGPPALALTAVDVGSDGAPLAVDGHRVTSLGETEAAIRDLGRGWVVIRADRDAPFGSVLSVVTVVQGLGESVAFGVSPKPSQDAPKPHAKPGIDACPFPPESDVADIDEAFVLVEVEVDPTGHARGVRVLADPGHGFGRQARACAMAATYEPARDGEGHEVDGVLRVRFHFSRPPPGPATHP